MKFIYLIPIAAILLNCSNTKKQELISKDSINTDSVSVQPVESVEEETNTSETNYEEIADEPENDSLALVISNAVDSVANEMEQNSGEYYSISTNSDGYESGSESTWYFDKSMNLKYCRGSWDMEGTSGRFAYYFDDDELVASSTEDDYQEGSESTVLHIDFKPDYGFTRSVNGEGGGSLSYASESTYNSINAEAKNQYSNLLELIRNNLDSATVANDEVSIHLESTQNYGFDFTSKQDYSISKKLFDKLFKGN